MSSILFSKATMLLLKSARIGSLFFISSDKLAISIHSSYGFRTDANNQECFQTSCILFQSPSWPRSMGAGLCWRSRKQERIQQLLLLLSLYPKCKGASLFFCIIGLKKIFYLEVVERLMHFLSKEWQHFFLWKKAVSWLKIWLYITCTCFDI